MEDTELVNIPVPKKYLGRVYTYIGSLDAPSPVVKQSATNDASGADELWPADLIERQYRESPPSMKKFQQYLADHPGEEFSTAQIATALNAKYGWNTIAGMLGAYGNRVANRYKRNTFPFQTRWDYDHGYALHSMTPEVAKIIKALA